LNGKLIGFLLSFQQDLLDSSYHADAEEEEEERDADCSCSSTGESTTSSSPTTPKRSPQKSLLSLNCWQSSQPSSDSNPEEEEEPEEDSDAGISDCCQLLAENSPNSMSKRRRTAPGYLEGRSFVLAAQLLWQLAQFVKG